MVSTTGIATQCARPCRLSVVGGVSRARHVRGDVYEVRAGRAGRAWRVLFATEGHMSQVLLAVTAFEKKTPETPPPQLVLAEQRLKDWRRRARPS